MELIESELSIFANLLAKTTPVLEIPPRSLPAEFKFAWSLQKRVFRNKFWTTWFDGLPFRINTTYMVGPFPHIG